MSKFNVTSTQRGNMRNHEGGASYKIDDEKKAMAGVVLASMLNGDSFYESDADRINRVFDLVANMKDKEFVAKAMIYARHEGNLRSISHLLANALVENNNGTVPLRRAIRKAVIRPDDMIEMFALWKNRHNGVMLPNSMRRAFADLLGSGKWDAYQLNKYKCENRAVKLRDVILVSHPKDKDGNLKGVIEGNLKAPDTVEKMLSSGKKASATFEELLKEGRLGYMVAVKNIRNALETGISDSGLNMWANMISDRRRVLKSRMLPFRFVDAWEAVRNLPVDHFKLQKVKDAFDQALIHSAMNLDFINEDDKVAIVLDESTSMQGDAWKHAITLAAVLYHALPNGNAVVYKFSGGCHKIDFGNKSPIDIIFGTRHSGGMTLFEAPLGELLRTKTKVDKLVIMSDMQMYDAFHYGWGSEVTFDKYWNEYKSNINPKTKILMWDLKGYNTGTPLKLRNDILFASGFSDKLLAVIPRMWRDENALVKDIESIVI